MTFAKNMWTFLPAVVNVKNKAYHVLSAVTPVCPTTVAWTPARKDVFVGDSQLYCPQISSECEVVLAGNAAHSDL